MAVKIVWIINEGEQVRVEVAPDAEGSGGSTVVLDFDQGDTAVWRVVDAKFAEMSFREVRLFFDRNPFPFQITEEGQSSGRPIATASFQTSDGGAIGPAVLSGKLLKKNGLGTKTISEDFEYEVIFYDDRDLLLPAVLPEPAVKTRALARARRPSVRVVRISGPTRSGGAGLRTTRAVDRLQGPAIGNVPRPGGISLPGNFQPKPGGANPGPNPDLIKQLQLINRPREEVVVKVVNGKLQVPVARLRLSEHKEILWRCPDGDFEIRFNPPNFRFRGTRFSAPQGNGCLSGLPFLLTGEKLFQVSYSVIVTNAQGIFTTLATVVVENS